MEMDEDGSDDDDDDDHDNDNEGDHTGAAASNRNRFLASRGYTIGGHLPGGARGAALYTCFICGSRMSTIECLASLKVVKYMPSLKSEIYKQPWRHITAHIRNWDD